MSVKEKVMEEFIKQFIQKDCKDILVDDIADNLSMSKRTIYENFHSKNEIIRQTLSHYLKIEHEKILEDLKSESNPLAKILITSFSFLNSVSHINLTRLYNLKKQYPDIADELIHAQQTFFDDVILKAYTQAQKEGYIFEEIEPEILLALLLGGERDPRQKTTKLFGNEFDTLKLFAIHLFTIIRGVSTFKGVEICDSFYQKWNTAIKKN